jgi:phosphatidylserine/phosphatidylglycerophosphate/cardiolipin synthase-like enzyme
VNGSAISQLQSAGVDVRDAPNSFEHAHAKIIFVDDVGAVVMSANLNAYSMVSERNYGIVNRDPADLDDIARIFDADFEGGAAVALDCTRLIVSPVNAKQRLLAFIGGAHTTLDLAVMYISDSQLKNAVKGRAQAGVVVRVLLADPAWISSNPNTAADLAAAGVAVRYLKAWELHAKLIVADNAAFIGSENLSWTALNKNREIGVLVTEAAPAASIASQFSQDWAAGVTAP